MTAPAAGTADARPATAPGRERYLDVYRAVALMRVVVYHTFGYAWLTILFPAMGVMFAVAGSLTARSLERAPGSAVVRGRLRRLLPSVWAMGLILVPAMLLHGWSTRDAQWPLRWHELAYWVLPVFNPPGSEWAVNAVGPLWYIRAYLWFVLLSPLLLWAFRRWPVGTVLMPLALVVASGFGVPDLTALGQPGSALRDFATYGACWVLGFAHRSGALQRLRLPVAAGVAAVVMAVGLGWALSRPDPVLGVDLNEIPVAQALWSVGVVLLLLRWAPRLDWMDRAPVIRWLVGLISARAVTIYLWHNLAIDMAVVVNHALGRYSGVELFLTTLALTAVPVLALGWIEDVAARRPPQLVPGVDWRPRLRPGAHSSRWRYALGAVVAVVAVTLMGRAVAGNAPVDVPPREEAWTVGAYLAPWDEVRGLASMPHAGPVLTSVSPVWYTPGDDGQVVRNVQTSTEPVFHTAHVMDIEVIPSISNFRDGVWDSDVVSRIVNDPQVRRTHVDEIVRVVVGQGWDGIDIDYEALDGADLRAYALFLEELATALHEQDLKLTVALHAATGDASPETVELYEAAGEVADEVRVMAYDLAWNDSPPGPVAPVDWVGEVIDFAAEHVPAERIVLGLATHGYSWPSGSSGEDLMWVDAVELADEEDSEPGWDERFASPWFEYTADGVEHTAWFEDARSLSAKLDLAAEQELGGVFLWRLGGEDPDVWPALRETDEERESAGGSLDEGAQGVDTP